MRLRGLPGWVVDNATSVREEVEPYVGMSLADRWQSTRRCSEAAAKMLRFHARPDRALDHVDALPESTLRALDRLRRHAQGS